MPITIQHSALYRIDIRTRMPFRYGIATVLALPHVFLRVTVDIDGHECHGIAADHLPPKWFTKVPEALPEDEIDEMIQVIRQAMTLAGGRRARTPFDLWQSLYVDQAQWGQQQDLAPLLTHFGVTLVERAVIDAFCRHTGQTFARALRDNTLGIRLGDVRPELAGMEPANLLPESPLPRILARHTVGLSDPLDEADIEPGERLEDGLPQSLQACIERYGLRHFKLKVGGDIEQDVARLHAIADTIERYAPADYAFSIDGNESYATLADFKTFWDTLRASQRLAPFLDHLLFVEQPLHRDIALSPEVGSMNRQWPQRPPTIIDESDATLQSLPLALELGYAGTSHKNCKGVFKGIANACLLAQRRKMQPRRPLILSGEDLSNIGPVALLQDLAVQASLGIESIERNGHHYFPGLSMYPEAIRQETLRAHGDLYTMTDRGWPAAAIRDGYMRIESVLRAPFGIGYDLDPGQFTRIA